MMHENICTIKDINSNTMINRVGEKVCKIAEISKAKYQVPRGFVLDSVAYFNFLQENNIKDKIKDLISNLDYENSEDITKVTEEITNLILKGKIDQNLKAELEKNYNKIGESAVGWLNSKIDSFAAVRLSLSSENLSKKDIDFFEDMGGSLNVKGIDNLILKIKENYASIFCEDCLKYAKEHNIDLFEIGVSVLIQKMINASHSGILITTKDNSSKDILIIEAIYGIGGSQVIKEQTPDIYECGKKNLTTTNKTKSKQTWMLKREKGQTIKEDVPLKDQEAQKIDGHIIRELTNLGKRLEELLKEPQVVEWAIEKAEVYIIKTNPKEYHEKTKMQANNANNSNHQRKINEIIKEDVLEGFGVSQGVVTGTALIVSTKGDLMNANNDSIIITQMTNYEMIPYLKDCKGIITDQGSMICHAAVIADKYKIPCIVNTKSASKVITSGQKIQMNGKTGKISIISTSYAQDENNLINDLVNSSDDQLEEDNNSMQETIDENLSLEQKIKLAVANGKKVIILSSIKTDELERIKEYYYGEIEFL
ncbi:MAG: PEP/pyruvate-binding domain-containing protein [archaeon]